MTDFLKQAIMVDKCVKAGKVQMLKELLMNSHTTVSQLRGAMYSKIDELEGKNENSNKCKA